MELMGQSVKPCPFCGGEGIVYPDYEEGIQYSVMCRSCHACTDYKRTAAEAIATWNRRV